MRMLKGGRPFVLEFVNPIKSISEVTEEEALSLFEESEREEMVTRVNEYTKGVLA